VEHIASSAIPILMAIQIIIGIIPLLTSPAPQQLLQLLHLHLHQPPLLQKQLFSIIDPKFEKSFNQA
jgi:hypothetical protein